MNTAPAELSVVVADGVRVLDGGRVLIGGAPARALSLTAHGAGIVAGWARPAPVGVGRARQALARRMLDAGLLAPVAAGDRVRFADLTFVVPVRDRPAQLARCLAALAVAAPGAAVIVVDDGSAEPVVRADGVRVLRHAASRGPAAARNTGLAACVTAFVGFVDSDVVVSSDCVRGLLAHLRDPRVAAVAPRVCSLTAHGAMAAYEARHSPLDVGPHSGLVGPDRPLGWVPSAVMFVRRAAIGIGFDESLPVGEDVDLVWGLVGAGWSVRYAAQLSVLHERPSGVRDFVGRRRAYALSVGALARRHPAALPAVRLTMPQVLIWGSLAARRPALTTLAIVWAVGQTQRGLAPVARSPALAARLTLGSTVHSGLALGRAVRRAWSPLLLLASSRSRWARPILAAAIMSRLAEDALDARGLHISDAPLRLLDEMVGAWGTWEGCIRARTMRPLLPAIRRTRRR